MRTDYFRTMALVAVIAVIAGGCGAGGTNARTLRPDAHGAAPAPAAADSSGQANYPTFERDTDRPGEDYDNFDLPREDFELCRKACAGDSNCRAYTYVKPGVQGAAARCWLKSGVPPAASSSCCISGVQVGGGRKDPPPPGEADLAGTWRAVVDAAEGRWDYTLVLKRQSAGKWSGTLTFTLDGKSPTTTGAAVESLGGEKIKMIWRPGNPNEESFEGTYANDTISVDGYGGQLSFTRQ